jgi:hypothetical protein
MDSIYQEFSNYIDLITTNYNMKELNRFKEHPSVTYMLEHVTYELGKKYLFYIQKDTPYTMDKIIEYCQLNDKFGGGQKYNYDIITTSPSNFRYIFHSYLILNHIKKLNLSTLNLLEVGCGYGGLCIALLYFSKFYNITINKYYCVDLPTISKLQQFYLSHFDNKTEIVFCNALEYGQTIQDNNLFLVSNYCFSEVSNENQVNYVKHLFPKVSHGFMVWNHIPLYDFGFKVSSEEEYPQTSTNYPNRYVYF